MEQQILIIKEIRVDGRDEMRLIPLTDKRGFFQLNKWGEGPTEEEISAVLEDMQHPKYRKHEGEVLNFYFVGNFDFSPTLD